MPRKHKNANLRGQLEGCTAHYKTKYEKKT
jgi:hypothetical protein